MFTFSFVPRTVARLSVMAVFAALPANAVPIDLDFKFDGVSGTFYGLDNEIATEQSASSWDFQGIVNSFTNMTLAGRKPNTFTFVSGTLSNVRVEADWFGPAGSVYLSFYEDPPHTTGFLYEDICDDPVGMTCLQATSKGTVTYSQRVVPPVPLPAGGLLLLTGVVGIAAAHRRKKRVA